MMTISPLSIAREIAEREGEAASLRVGVDVVAVARVRRLQEDPAFLQRAFHPSEAAGASPERLAGLLALKEAVAKAVGRAPPPWREIAVGRAADGRPVVTLAPALAVRARVLDASVSHDADVAVAIALVAIHDNPAHAP